MKNTLHDIAQKKQEHNKKEEGKKAISENEWYFEFLFNFVTPCGVDKYSISNRDD